ncbi:uridine diphosphate glucose pyrophosphatase NUDT22 [Thalassophryne amazonica]|uniref:uridine diphosphate glucose pyrophosphatase NUDT22 n=1 Tax=Thalassophryne amazonica TaxID=390379 RepID=UPI0014720FEB|nr:uridine diphosphate glucose pyrophosphatase NUDT22 [Thalassophryne amazonica]XP_034037358.1 uridine diphosphate glucose pyrophosphatase NUDT22 [Thalassophryne amazonica]
MNLNPELSDPEVSVLLHFAAWQGLLESQVRVELSERYNRQTDPALERHIEQVWTERVSKEPWLFNGAKFRLHSFHLASPKYFPSSPITLKHPACSLSAPISSLSSVEDQKAEFHSRKRWEENLDAVHEDLVTERTAQNRVDGRNLPANLRETVHCDCRASESVTAHCSDKNKNVEDSRPFLTFRLGLTCYKDFLGTNWSSRAAELRRHGEAEFGDPLALLAQPLGVGAVLCTDDGQVVLLRRSQQVAEAGGLLDIPGGHPEPKAVCEEWISVATLQQRPGAVVSELFSSVCAEIRDEVNVPLSSLGPPVLMGVALNHTSAGRPSAEFFISCSLFSDAVRKLYWKGGPEAHESTDIVFLSRKEILQLDSSSPLWLELCPSAKGAVLLYQMVKPDRTRPEQNGIS